MTPSEVTSLVEQLSETGNMPASVTQSTVKEIGKSFARYFNQLSADKIAEFTDKAVSVLKDQLNTSQIQRPGADTTTTVGESKSTARSSLFEFLSDNTPESIGDTMNLDFFLRIPAEVAAGAAQKLAQNWDQDRVDAYPALEFHRVYDRIVPRGSEKDPAGPENAWDDDEGRWPAACEAAGDDDAAKVYEETGRCVALKSSGVWQELGNGAGGYTDTLGNDFAPFAFNSGWDTDEVSYDEAVKLGLIDDGDDVEAPELDFEDLIPGIEASCRAAMGIELKAGAPHGHPFYGNQWTSEEGNDIVPLSKKTTLGSEVVGDLVNAHPVCAGQRRPVH